MASFSTGFQAPGSWQWPDDLLAQPSSTSVPQEPTSVPETKTELPRGGSSSQRRGTRHWRPRQCRICLEVVLPTFQPLSEYLPDVLQSEPTVTYESEGGRLIQPCKCKGSSRYVHESCLQEWRHADPTYGRRNYWQCPTCHFQYRLERMRWGRWISSQATQVFLTLSCFVLAMFLLGFVADPIINLYLDPYNTMSSLPTVSRRGFEEVHLLEEEIDRSGWVEHFIKGFASLGLLGMIKVFFSGSLRIFHFRSGLGNNWNRAGTTGRDRIDSVTWLVIIAGVCTFLYMVWKTVRAWSRRVLEKASEHVIDVQGGDDDEEDEEEQNSPKDDNA